MHKMMYSKILINDFKIGVVELQRVNNSYIVKYVNENNLRAPCSFFRIVIILWYIYDIYFFL